MANEAKEGEMSEIARIKDLLNGAKKDLEKVKSDNQRSGGTLWRDVKDLSELVRHYQRMLESTKK